MLLDLRSLVEAADVFTGHHTGEGECDTSVAVGEVTPGVTVFPGVHGPPIEIQRIVAAHAGVGEPDESKAAGPLVFDGNEAGAEVEGRVAARAGQIFTGRGIAADLGRAASTAGAGQVFRSRRISGGVDPASIASKARAAARFSATGRAEELAAASAAAASQRLIGQSKGRASPDGASASAGQRFAAIARQRDTVPADTKARGYIRHRAAAEGKAAVPEVAVAVGSMRQVLACRGLGGGEPDRAAAEARRRFRADPVALWLLGVDDHLQKAS